MPLIQVRDVPEHIYRLLVELAERERRSLAQQVVAVLARCLRVDVDVKARRRALLDAIRSGPSAQAGKLINPAGLIHEDRRR
ncbi:MAG: hypothetical protein ABSH47_14930 [Bryobacteraceae bacterium]|jgi:hypothetical protein